MIVQLRKFLIYGIKSELDLFFERAQRAGFMEFIGLGSKKSLELPEKIKTVLAAINIAKHHEIHPLAAPPLPDDPVELAKKVVELNAMHEQFLEEQRLLTDEIARIAPFGNFNKEDLVQIEKEGKLVMQFFCMKSDLASKTKLPPEVIYITTQYDLDYFIALNPERTQYPNMIEIVIDRPVGELRMRAIEVDERIAALESDIRHYSNALPFLQTGLIDLLNDFHLNLAKHDASSPLGDAIFAIEAWVPKTKVKGLMGLLSTLKVCAEEVAIEPGEKVPTCMENKGAGKIGEDVVLIYDTPSSTDKDPSLWVLTFFSIFFAMIISDAGYGLVYLLLGLYLKFKFPNLAGAGKRFLKLVFIVSSACIIWGIASASFFGIEIGPNNPFRRMSFMHSLAVKKAEYHMERKDEVYEEYLHQFPAVATATDGHDFLLKASSVVNGKMDYKALSTFYDNILMELALVMGVIHLSLSFMRYCLRNWASFGWIIFLFGGYLFFPKILHCATILNFSGLVSKETAYAWGQQMVYIGIGLAVFGAVLQRKWAGLHEIMNTVNVFADVISYVRLYALALAGMIIANMSNTLGVEAGLFAGALIIIVGHTCNLGLSLMAGIIHGLRLNFLEWYHYSFEGDGRIFNPLRLKKTR